MVTSTPLFVFCSPDYLNAKNCLYFLIISHLYTWIMFLIYYLLMQITHYCWTINHQWTEIFGKNNNTSLTFSVWLKVAVDWWRRDVTHAARAVAHWCCTAFPGRQSGRKSWEVKVVWTRTHGNVVVLGAVSQGSVERRGGGARVHRYIVVFGISTVWAGKWRFLSLPKDVRMKLKVGSRCRISIALSLLLWWCREEMFYQVGAEAIIDRFYWLTRVIKIVWTLIAGLKWGSCREDNHKKPSSKIAFNNKICQSIPDRDFWPMFAGGIGVGGMGLGGETVIPAEISKQWAMNSQSGTQDMKLLHLTLHCLPIILSGNMAAKHRCMNRLLLSQQGQKVTSCYSRHVGLAWLSTEPLRRPRPEPARPFFLCLSGRNESLWDLMHGLNFIILPADQSGTSQIASVSNQMRAENGKEMKTQEGGMEMNQSITDQGSSESLR